MSEGVLSVQSFMTDENNAGKGSRAKRAEGRRRIYQAIDKVADGRWHDGNEFPLYLRGASIALSVIPWLEVEWLGGKFIFNIDHHLREICDGDRRRPELDQLSVREFLHRMHEQIIQKRKENRDENLKRKWNPEAISKRQQSDLLDWIEAELKRISL